MAPTYTKLQSEVNAGGWEKATPPLTRDSPVGESTPRACDDANKVRRLKAAWYYTIGRMISYLNQRQSDGEGASLAYV